MTMNLMDDFKIGDYAIWDDENAFKNVFQVGDLVKIYEVKTNFFRVSSLRDFYKIRFKEHPAKIEDIVKAKLLGKKIHE